MKTFGFTINLGGFVIEAETLEEAKKEICNIFKKTTREEIENMLELKYIENEYGDFEYVAKDEEQESDCEVVQ